MSEKAPTVNTEMIDDLVKVDKNGKARREDGKFLSNHQVEMVDEYQDVIRDNMDEYSDAPKEQAERLATDTTEGSAPTNTGELRPIEDGEYGENYMAYPENTDPNHPDYLPVGAMAHEPWTLANNHEGATTATPRTSERDHEVIDDGGVVTNTPSNGRYSYDGKDLHNGGREDMNPTAGRTPENGGYDGPVEPGSEIEPVGPSDIEPIGPTDIVPAEKPGELVQMIEVDPAVIERLDIARSRYAETTAKSRKSYLGRFFKPDTQVGGLLGKIPGMQKAVDKWNDIKASKPVQGFADKLSSVRSFNAETEAAQQEYEEAYTALSEATAAELQRVGWEEEVVQSLSLIGNIAQDAKLEDQILYQRQLQSKKTNGFVNFWVSQQGLKGKFMKAGAVVGIGAAVGLTGGLFAGATAAYIAGGAAGASVGKHVTSRRANGINKHNGLTVAVEQSRGDSAVAEADIRARHTLDGVGSVEDITKTTEASTDAEMMRNRKRVRTATALGAAAGKGVFKLKEFFDHRYRDPSRPPEAPKDPTPPEAPKDPTPQPPKTPDVPKPPTPEAPKGLQFNVEPGSGFEREFRQFFEANGKPIDGQQAHDLYKHFESTVGSDNIIKPLDTYARAAGDTGISSPGMAEWSPEAERVLTSLLRGA